MRPCPYPDCDFIGLDAKSLAWHLYLEHRWVEGCKCGRTMPMNEGVQSTDSPWQCDLAAHIDEFPSLAQHIEETKEIAAVKQGLLETARSRRSQ